MRNLVTGGAGFIGSHLCKALLDKGEEVVCLDNLSSGRITNIEPLKNRNTFTFVEADTTEPYQVNADRIYNLACPASPPFYQADPIKTSKTNVLGVINILDLAVTTKAKVLHASTSEVYGDPIQHPQKETYWGNVNPIGIRSCYDEGKRLAESLCFDYLRTYNVDVKVVRIFNTYGPNMRIDDGRVISNLLVQGLKGEPLPIYGSGMQTRSFCYVDDLVEGLMVTMNSPDSVHGPFNLGNPEEYTILQLATTIKALLNTNLELEFKRLPEDDPKQRKPDITLIQEVLGWNPSTTLVEGLEKTIQYFKTQLD